MRYDQGLGSWPARRRRADPDGVALQHGGTSLTWRELDTRVNNLAAGLRASGVRRGDRVACLSGNSPVPLETLFAAGRLGAIFVPFNTRLTAPEVAVQVGDCEPAVLIHDDARAEAAAAAGASLMLGPVDYERLAAADSADPIDEPVELADPCLILYTSGTTGTPKGAVLTHGNLTWNALNVLIEVDLGADEIAVIVTPLFHSAALSMNALPVLLKGGTLVIAESTRPADVLGLVERHAATHLQGVPTFHTSLVDSERWASTDTSTLRRVVSGGSAASAELIQRFLDRGIRFCQGYGMTETAPGALYLGPERSTEKIGSVGRAMFFTDVRIVDPEGVDVPPGERGEIVVSGPNVMAGYWNRPVETAAVLTSDGAYRSGDIGVFDDDGDGYIVDRIKDMFISGGENVYPAEVEAVLGQHPAVLECAVIGEPDERWGEVGRAFVVTRAPLDADELIAYATERLAKYKVPKHVVALPDLPHNATGKVQKPLLRAQWAAMTTSG